MHRPVLLLASCCAVFSTGASPAHPLAPEGSPGLWAAQYRGPRITDCRSALRPGWTRCATPAQQAWAVMRQHRIDERISAFLADYGKPPRYAVRALLDPTDDNIRAWIRAQQKTLAAAAYVARRMTALQRNPPAEGAASVPPKPASGIQP